MIDAIQQAKRIFNPGNEPCILRPARYLSSLIGYSPSMGNDVSAVSNGGLYYAAFDKKPAGWAAKFRKNIGSFLHERNIPHWVYASGNGDRMVFVIGEASRNKLEEIGVTFLFRETEPTPARRPQALRL